MNSGRARIDLRSRIGVWWTSDTWPIVEVQDVVREIESLGYGSFFFGEVANKECLTQSAAFLAATSRLVVGTGIANVHARVATAAEVGGRTLSALYPGRFVLGLGVSHAPFVTTALGGTYANPLATMRDYLKRMDAVPAEIEPGAGRAPRLLAALGPKMVELSGSHADGAHPYLVLPEHTQNTRSVLGPDKWIITEQPVAIGGSTDDQLGRAHQHLDPYTLLPNYLKSWERQGFGEDDLVRGGSDRLARALVATGTVEAAVASVHAHLHAGADHVVVQVLGDRFDSDPRPSLRELAAALELTHP